NEISRKGKELVEKEIRARNIELKEALTQENLERVNEKFNFTNEEDMYAAVGYQGITAALVANRLTDNLRKEEEQDIEKTIEEVVKSDENIKKSVKKDSGIKVEGV